MKCDHDIPEVTESLKRMRLPKKLFESVLDNHKNGVCQIKPILISELVQEMVKLGEEALERIRKMTKEEASSRVLELVKEGLQWHDQFQGHGHWEFHLPPEKFNELFEATKIADGVKA